MDLPILTYCCNLVLFVSEPSQVADIAEAVQVRLDAYKADKRDLGAVSVMACYHSIVN